MTAAAPPPIATIRSPDRHTDRSVNTEIAPPTAANATATALPTHDRPHTGDPEQEGHERHDRADGERDERRDRRRPRRAQIAGVQAEFLSGERVERDRRIGDDPLGKRTRLSRVHALTR